MEKTIKILAICGSPHKGNTYGVLRMLQEAHPEIDFNILMLSEQNLKDCLGCYSCINEGEVSCPHHDDRDVIIEAMKDADGTIFASPTYARAVSSLMKKFIERTSYLAHRPMFFGKYAIALATCAGFGADMTCKYMSENFSQYGFQFVDSLELMIATKSEKENNHNRTVALKSFQKMIQAIKTKQEIKPTFGQLVYFNIFKSISELNRLKGWADYEFYKNKKDYYYDIKIPYLKNKFAKWIASKEVKKLMANK